MVGEADVEDDRVGGSDGDLLEGLGPVAGQGDLVSLQPEGPVEGAADRRIVIDHEDSHRAGSLSGSYPIAVARVEGTLADRSAGPARRVGDGR